MTHDDIAPLNDTMLDTLLDLHHAAQGEPDVYFIVQDVHHSTLQALEDNRGLIVTREDASEDGSPTLLAALTPLGVSLGTSAKNGSWHKVPTKKTYPSERKRKRVTHKMFFDVTRRDHRKAAQVVQGLKDDRQFMPTMIKLLQFYDALAGGGGVDALRAHFPDIAQDIEQDALAVAEQNQLSNIHRMLASGTNGSANGATRHQQNGTHAHNGHHDGGFVDDPDADIIDVIEPSREDIHAAAEQAIDDLLNL